MASAVAEAPQEEAGVGSVLEADLATGVVAGEAAEVSVTEEVGVDSRLEVAEVGLLREAEASEQLIELIDYCSLIHHSSNERE